MLLVAVMSSEFGTSDLVLLKRSSLSFSQISNSNSVKLPPSDVNLRRAEAVAKDVDYYNRLNESYWRARSREVNLKEGDKNSNFFHSKASGRRKKNLIYKIQDADGQWKTTDEEIASCFMRILLSDINARDSIPSTDGVFSVSSAYRLASQSVAAASSNGSPSAAQPFSWKLLWNLKFPPMLKVFLWKLCSDCIPAKGDKAAVGAVFRDHNGTILLLASKQ